MFVMKISNMFVIGLLSTLLLMTSCDQNKVVYLPEPPENPIVRPEKPDAPEEPATPPENPVTPPDEKPETNSDLSLPYIFSDNMVLQQNAQVAIYGTDRAGVEVTVVPSWSGTPYKGVTGVDGNWFIRIGTPSASYTTHTIKITDTDGGELSISDVLVGEVWLCSGQSNMEHPMKGFNYGETNHEPVDDYSTEITDSDYQYLRYFRVPKNVSRIPLYDTEPAKWVKCTRQSAPDWSAIGFFFGRSIHKKVGVPVGIVACPYGGTRIEGWMPESLVSTLAANTIKRDGLTGGEQSPSYPSNCYNAMMHPVIDFGYRGMLWFQGETNSDALAWAYAGHLRDIVKAWRERMGVTADKLPFYYVQLAPWVTTWEDAATLRHCQFRGVGFGTPLIENCGIVGASDVGSEVTIHFPQKKVIADRLVLWAMHNQYGDRNVNPMGPYYMSHTVQGNKVIVTMANADGLRYIDGAEKVLHAEIAPAPVKINNKTVYDWTEADVEILSDGRLSFSSTTVSSPEHVRYCFSTWHVGTLCNGAGLPLFPFSTEKYSKIN